MVVGTRVPINTFNFEAVEASISVSGSVEMKLIDDDGSGRELHAEMGRNLQTANQESTFELQVPLEGNRAPKEDIITNPATYIAIKGLAGFGMIFASAYAVW